MSDSNSITEKGYNLPRWRRIVLPASIILNLFLIALISGHTFVVRIRYAGGNEGLPLARALARVEQILPSKDAAAFDAVMRRDAPQYLDAARQLKEARARLDRELTADKFDQAAARQSMVQAQAAWNAFADKVSGPLVEALGSVSAEGRRKLIAQRQTERVEP
jgi:uncharacterized membrane protein